MKRFAFTMLELVFVIIVVGILSILGMPNLQSNPLDEAAEQIANHIRYTQHLAMVDNKYDPNVANWFVTKWQIRFRRNSGTFGYAIFSDMNRLRNIDPGEAAIDPTTGQGIDGFNNYAPADLTNKYDIRNIVQTCFTPDATLVTANQGVFAFDNLGRPYSGLSNAVTPLQYILRANCDLILTNSNNQQIGIRVFPETGYVCVLNQARTACR